MKQVNVNAWVKAIKENKHSYYGIRWTSEDECYCVGDIARNSYDWNLEEDRSTFGVEDIELDGTCAIEIVCDPTFDDDDEIAEAIKEALKNQNGYWGEPVLLGCRNAEYGNDAGEIIMEDAVVIAM